MSSYGFKGVWSEPCQGVQAVIRNSTGEVLMGFRTGGIVGSGTWGLVGGRVREGEDIVQAILREIEEETGIKVSVGRMKYLGGVDTTINAGEDHKQGVFTVDLLPSDEAPVIKEPSKCAAFKYFSLDTLPDNIFEPTAQIFKNMQIK